MHWDLSRARVLRRRRQRRQPLPEREALEVRASGSLHPHPPNPRPAATQAPSRALPADMASFHQLSVEGEQTQALDVS